MNMEKIRQISDGVLHKSPQWVDFSDLKWDLNAIYQTMLGQLIITGGVGIAANQCAEIENPPQMIICGIPLENKELLQLAKQRYPDHEFPNAVLMINPKIIHESAETYFPEHGEGCLSVKGALRGRVKRAREVTVNFFDLTGQEHTQTFSGFPAHIVQHECDHLRGIVYLQKILDELTEEALLTLKNLLSSDTIGPADSIVPTPVLAFDRDDNGNIRISSDTIANSRHDIDRVTREGILTAITHAIKTKKNIR